MLSRRPAVIANEIRFKRPQHQGAFLVVEGRDDRLLHEKFSDKADCRIVVAENRQNVCEVIQILDADGVAGVCGVIDSDHARILGTPTGSPNLLLTPHCDLDATLVRSPALASVLVEFGSAAKIDQFSHPVVDALVRAAIPIGYLRLQSKREGLSLKFAGLNYGQFLSPQTLETDLHSLAQEVRNKSQRFDLSVDSLVARIQTVSAENLDIGDLCVGDDLLGSLSFGLRQTLGNNDAGVVKPDELRKALRLAFANADFSVSVLRQSMADWETHNPPFRLSRSTL